MNDKPEKQTYTVSVYYAANVLVEVRAASSEEAREKAEAHVRDHYKEFPGCTGGETKTYPRSTDVYAPGD